MDAEKKGTNITRRYCDKDLELIKTLIWLASEARDANELFDAEAYESAAARLEELTCWKDIELEQPPEGDIVLAIVNGQIGGVKLFNSIEAAEYFGVEGWLFESYLEFRSDRGDHVNVKWWRSLPDVPDKIKFFGG